MRRYMRRNNKPLFIKLSDNRLQKKIFVTQIITFSESWVIGESVRE